VTKADRTREFIIETTAPLFNRKGYEGTSLQDILEATNLTKGALYGNFDSKEEIAAAAFRYSAKKVKSLIRERLLSINSCKAQLEALMDFFSEYIFNPPIPGGCPLQNTAIEADDHRTSMRRVVVKELNETVDFIESILKKGVRSGEFDKSIEPRRLAYIFFCSIEGALMFSRVERSREPMDIVINHCNNLLKQISK
jgi:TetR/AcrR family transcriptional regulator, transcriptional repressor for nem operon